jgi:hypothetical protein
MTISSKDEEESLLTYQAGGSVPPTAPIAEYAPGYAYHQAPAAVHPVPHVLVPVNTMRTCNHHREVVAVGDCYMCGKHFCDACLSLAKITRNHVYHYNAKRRELCPECYKKNETKRKCCCVFLAFFFVCVVILMVVNLVVWLNLT